MKSFLQFKALCSLRRCANALLLIFLVLPVAIALASVPADYLSPYLPPCSRHHGNISTLFPEGQFTSWPQRYHEKIRTATEEALALTKAGDLLTLPQTARELADILYPQLTSGERAALDRRAYGPIMLAYLQTYECVLIEYDYNITGELLAASAVTAFGMPIPFITSPTLTIVGLLQTQGLQRAIIVRELATARSALESALALTSGTSKLAPLDHELTRIQRASLDARNGLALAADAAMCLPARVWDAREVLRDLPPGALL